MRSVFFPRCLLFIGCLLFSAFPLLAAEEPIFTAAKNGDVATVERLLKANPALITATDTEYSAGLLHLAVSSPDKPEARSALVKLLLAQGANPNLKTKSGSTPLHSAAGVGLLDAVKQLLAKGVNMNAVDQDGNTPLHYAVSNGQKAVVEQLLAAKAETTVKNKAGLYPQQWTIIWSDSRKAGENGDRLFKITSDANHQNKLIINSNWNLFPDSRIGITYVYKKKLNESNEGNKLNLLFGPSLPEVIGLVKGMANFSGMPFTGKLGEWDIIGRKNSLGKIGVSAISSLIVNGTKVGITSGFFNLADWSSDTNTLHLDFNEQLYYGDGTLRIWFLTSDNQVIAQASAEVIFNSTGPITDGTGKTLTINTDVIEKYYGKWAEYLLNTTFISLAIRDAVDNRIAICKAFAALLPNGAICLIDFRRISLKTVNITDVRKAMGDSEETAIDMNDNDYIICRWGSFVLRCNKGTGVVSSFGFTKEFLLTLPPNANIFEEANKSNTKNANMLQQSIFPTFPQAIPAGANEVRVRNPNDFVVTVGLRQGKQGKDFQVPANGVQSVSVPNGKYDIYFVYSSKPDALFQGDSFTLANNGVEIQIVKVVNGNYNIKQVK
ncbi:MAG: ankyrin repeat domain-containing protein [Armatimonadota bacterium]